MADCTKTPWHLWIFGVVALLWNAMSAFDYVMTQTRNEAYMSQFTPQQLEYFYGFPAWVDAAWAIAVWSGVLAALLLLMRRGLAVPAFWVSFIAAMVTSIYTFGLAEISLSDVAGPFALVFSAIIIVVSLFLIWYAHRMRALGVLT